MTITDADIMQLGRVMLKVLEEPRWMHVGFAYGLVLDGRIDITDDEEATMKRILAEVTDG